MTIASPPITPPSAVPAWLGSSKRRLRIARITVLVVVLAILAGVGVFVHRVHATVLFASGTGFTSNTPLVDLPYGGDQRYVVDDSVGTVHPIAFSVENAGPDAITLQGVDDFLGDDVAGFKLSRVGSGGPGADIGTAPRIPLPGVRLSPGQQVNLVMYVKGQGCVSGSAGASTTISTVPVTVTVEGIQRVEWIVLPTLVTIMNSSTAGAPSDPRRCLRSDS